MSFSVILRDFGALAVSFAVCALLGPVVIPFLRRLKFGQSIREEGPQSHQVKSGTPTMGGIMMLTAILLAVLIFAPKSTEAWLAVLATLAFGAIGFCDDFIKVVRKRSMGLSAKQKLLMQIIVSIFFTLLYVHTEGGSTNLKIPFTELTLSLKWLYFPFVVFWFTGFSNAVNLTDGLDGLAAGVTAVAAAALFYIAAVSAGPAAPGVTVFCAALLGACLGFLLFNHYPAKVFMGDTGSLALGGAITAVSVLTDTELLLILIGGVYVIETLSVILQVISFQTTGRRIFLMSPIHHHFELKGYKEPQVVRGFCIAAAVFALTGILGL